MQRRRKCEENRQFSETHILQTTYQIFFKIDMWSHVCGGIKYVNLVEIGPVVIEIWGVENGD